MSEFVGSSPRGSAFGGSEAGSVASFVSMDELVLDELSMDDESPNTKPSASPKTSELPASPKGFPVLSGGPAGPAGTPRGASFPLPRAKTQPVPKSGGRALPKRDQISVNGPRRWCLEDAVTDLLYMRLAIMFDRKDVVDGGGGGGGAGATVALEAFVRKLVAELELGVGGGTSAASTALLRVAKVPSSQYQELKRRDVLTERARARRDLPRVHSCFRR